MQLGLLAAGDAAPAERGRCRVHFGDWREAEPSWPRPFVFVSDVPYGVAACSNFKRNGTRALAQGIKGDADTTQRDAALAVSGWQAAAIFGPGGVKLLSVPPWGKPRALNVWDKADYVGTGDLRMPWGDNWETIALYGDGWAGKRTSGVLRHNVLMAMTLDHPHEKPLPLVCEYVAKAPPGHPIVDPFMGSGTTAVACALLGREFYGAEIDPQYWPKIRRKLSAVGVVLP
jgi:site-specific DNA-methyltransferase (adenine-specific)